MRFALETSGRPDDYDLALYNPLLLLIQFCHACAVITLHLISQGNANRFSKCLISIIMIGAVSGAACNSCA